jgi:uncharacterized glyoxalase superfamily protein PhnB
MAMGRRVRPMIHVPDVRVTVAWYQSVGFEIVQTHEDEGEMNWALMSFGDGHVMFNAGGARGAATRREVDLYIDTEKVEDLYQRIKGRVDVQEGIHDTFYGMREFIVRDVNGFWVTFGESHQGVG